MSSFLCILVFRLCFLIIAHIITIIKTPLTTPTFTPSSTHRLPLHTYSLSPYDVTVNAQHVYVVLGNRPVTDVLTILLSLYNTVLEYILRYCCCYFQSLKYCMKVKIKLIKCLIDRLLLVLII